MEYVRLVLCRDVYHCDPVTAMSIPAEYVVEDLAMLSMENKVRKLRSGK